MFLLAHKALLLVIVYLTYAEGRWLSRQRNTGGRNKLISYDRSLRGQVSHAGSDTSLHGQDKHVSGESSLQSDINATENTLLESSYTNQRENTGNDFHKSLSGLADNGLSGTISDKTSLNSRIDSQDADQASTTMADNLEAVTLLENSSIYGQTVSANRLSSSQATDIINEQSMYKLFNDQAKDSRSGATSFAKSSKTQYPNMKYTTASGNSYASSSRILHPNMKYRTASGNSYASSSRIPNMKYTTASGKQSSSLQFLPNSDTVKNLNRTPAKLEYKSHVHVNSKPETEEDEEDLLVRRIFQDNGQGRMNMALRTDQTYNVPPVRGTDNAFKKSNCTFTGGKADCSSLNYYRVPDLPNPKNITELDLSNNSISTEALKYSPFVNYTNLIVLKLNSNKITYLPDKAFEGLEQLRTLALYNNSIYYNNIYSSQAFVPLAQSLEKLVLNRNSPEVWWQSCQYPDKTLSVLKNLQILFLDGIRDADFGMGFQELSKLTNLTLAGYNEGYCNMSSLKSTTFQYLSSLKYLNISECQIDGQRIDNDTFSPLYQLEVLDVSNNFQLGLEAVGDFMYGLRNNMNFRYLKMQRIGTRFAPCVVIYNKTLRHFKNTRIQSIQAMDNEIEMIEEGALMQLPSTLREVDLTNNKIMFGAYWRDMSLLRNLQSLYLDTYFFETEFPDEFPPSNLKCPLIRGQTHALVRRKKDQDIHDICRNDIRDFKSLTTKKAIHLPMPPNLKLFSMHNNFLTYTINNIHFCQPNTLEYVDLSDNMFPKLKGTIYGLSHLNYLKLSGCQIQYISATFFDNFPKLRTLNLYQNVLGDCLNEDTEGDVFDKLDKLEYLNLSFNGIYSLGFKIFKDLTSLKKLDISYNRISEVAFQINHMKSLTLLDIHKTPIYSLTDDIRNHIDTLSRDHKVTVDMRKNPIHCDCENLPFIQWVTETRIFGSNYTDYFCKYFEKEEKPVNPDVGYEEIEVKLTHICTPEYSIFVCVIGATLILVFFIVGVLVYRHRWTFRYWYHAAKLKMSSNPSGSSDMFDYDVFVCYAHEDTDFVMRELKHELQDVRGLRLLIHGQTFQVGRYITDNIIMAVRDCRKTLVVVTCNNLASYWCKYELQMARMESINTGRNVLVFMFKEEIPSSMMTYDLLVYIKTSTYITYPTEPEHRRLFWDKLAKDLGTL